jgi:hypothetical protein
VVRFLFIVEVANACHMGHVAVSLSPIDRVLRRDYDLMTDITMIDQLTEHDRIELLARAQDAWDRAPQDTMKAVFEWRGKNYVVSHSSVRLRIHTEEGIKVY